VFLTVSFVALAPFSLVVIVGDKVHTTWLEKGIYIDAILAKVRYGISSSITGANIASSIEGGEGELYNLFLLR
jgi:hypothetical protein